MSAIVCFVYIYLYKYTYNPCDSLLYMSSVPGIRLFMLCRVYTKYSITTLYNLSFKGFAW